MNNVVKIDDIKNKVAQVEKPNSIISLINKSVQELGKALPSHLNADRLVRIATTTLRKNPRLYECEPMSFLGALFQSAQLGLEPDVNGQCYILPYKANYKTKDESGRDVWKSRYDAQFIMGYKGYVDLFYRSSQGNTLYFETIYEGDEYDFRYGTSPFLSHTPKFKTKEPKLYYTVANVNGNSLFKVMSYEDIISHAMQHSKCYNKKEGKFMDNTPWVTDTDAMCKKVPLVQLMKTLPLSVQMQKAIAMDETIKREVAPEMELIKDETNWNEEEKQVDLEELLEDKKGE